MQDLLYLISMNRFFFIACMLLGCSTDKQPAPERQKLNEGEGFSSYYLAYAPEEKPKGILLLLPGFNQLAESIEQETQLPFTVAEAGWLVLAHGGGQTLLATDSIRQRFNRVLQHAQQQYMLPADLPLVVGGFSAGGTLALRFAEYAAEKPAEVPFPIEGVFSLDGPVDLLYLEKYFQRELDREFSDVGMAEAQYIQALFRQQLGNPAENKAAYEALSPFLVSKTETGNERYLKDVAVRVYHDLDVAWQLEQRRRSAYDMNFLNASELIARLRLLNNKRAEFMQSLDTGYRSSGEKHPHSWSIVGVPEMVKWLQQLEQK